MDLRWVCDATEIHQAAPESSRAFASSELFIREARTP